MPRLDPHDEGNLHLQSLVGRLVRVDQSKFAKLLQKQRLPQKTHTYRELLVGAHLRDRGFDVLYERTLQGKTPDWTSFDKSGQPLEILDVVTMHQKPEKHDDIGKSLQSLGTWSGWITVPPDHIYGKLSEKAGKYSKLVKAEDLPFVIAVYSDFYASISSRDLEHVLFEHHEGWFKTAPEVSGVIHFQGSSTTPFQFDFKYFKNPNAPHLSNLLG